VYQKEDFCKVFQTADRSIRSLNLLEYHIGLTALLLGKNKYLPVFYSVRELISNSAGTNIGLDVLVSDPNQAVQYEAFIAGVSKVFSVVQPMAKDHEGIIRKQISQYLSSENAKDFYSVRDRNRRIKRLIPSAIRQLIYHTWLSFNRKKNAQNNLRISSMYTGFPFGNALEESRLKQIEVRILNQK
jgi:phosphoenolpyruvate carboxylase